MSRVLSRVLFNLTAFATTAFVITILAMVAMLLGDPDSPINVWFNRHGSTVMIAEVSAIIFLGLAAISADRRESRCTRTTTDPTHKPPDGPGPM